MFFISHFFPDRVCLLFWTQGHFFGQRSQKPSPPVFCCLQIFNYLIDKITISGKITIIVKITSVIKLPLFDKTWFKRLEFSPSCLLAAPSLLFDSRIVTLVYFIFYIFLYFTFYILFLYFLFYILHFIFHILYSIFYKFSLPLLPCFLTAGLSPWSAKVLIRFLPFHHKQISNC